MNGPIAFYRRLYGPCLVYTATMIFSIFYHACDQESFSGSLPSGLQLTCLSLYVNNEVLQFCDFFSAILSFWVTVSFYFLNLFQQDWDSIPNCEQFILCLVKIMSCLSRPCLSKLEDLHPRRGAQCWNPRAYSASPM